MKPKEKIHRRILIGLIATPVFAGICAIALLYIQGTRMPDTTGEYVALGSSFAAGVGLGERTLDSPFACMRTGDSYPARLAKLIGLRLVDMTCSGATVVNILSGGQYFQRAQVAAIGPQAKLVTITAGGNDVGFIGDLTKMAQTGAKALLLRIFLGDSLPARKRDFAPLEKNLELTVAEIRRRAPNSRILVVTYPRVLPRAGTCPALHLSMDQAALMREVEVALLESTRLAASRSNAELVDMEAISEEHNVCSAAPWVSGARPSSGVAFHPNLDGAAAVANAVYERLRQ